MDGTPLDQCERIGEDVRRAREDEQQKAAAEVENVHERAARWEKAAKLFAVIAGSAQRLTRIDSKCTLFEDIGEFGPELWRAVSAAAQVNEPSEKTKAIVANLCCLASAMEQS